MKHIQEVFITNLKRLRKAAGLTQEQLAEELKMSQKHIGALEQGTKFPSVGMLQSFIDYFKIYPHELFIEPDLQNKIVDIEAYKAFGNNIKDDIEKSVQLRIEEYIKTITENN